MTSLDHRRDNRSIEEFAKDIANYTKKEHAWGIALRKHFCEICDII